MRCEYVITRGPNKGKRCVKGTGHKSKHTAIPEARRLEYKRRWRERNRGRDYMTGTCRACGYMCARNATYCWGCRKF